MSSNATAGHQTTLSFLHEDNGFNSAPNDTDHKPFGYGATADTLDISHNPTRLAEPNDRRAKKVIEQEFSGSWSVSFDLTNPWWLQSIFGAPSASGSAPYTYTYGVGVGGSPTSVRIFKGDDGVGFERVLGGCIVTDASVQIDVPGTITVTLNGAFADEPDSSISVTDQPALQRDPLQTHETELSRDGSVLGLVQSATLDITTNDTLLYELGSRNAVTHNPKALDVDLSQTRIKTDVSDRERAYGNDSTLQDSIDNTVPITITADNGKSGSAYNFVEFQLADVFPSDFSETGIGDRNSDIEAELSEIPVDATVVAENDSSEAR